MKKKKCSFPVPKQFSRVVCYSCAKVVCTTLHKVTYHPDYPFGNFGNAIKQDVFIYRCDECSRYVSHPAQDIVRFRLDDLGF